jgi:hypothetical protein
MKRSISKVVASVGLFSIASIGISSSSASTLTDPGLPYVVQADQSPAGSAPRVEDKVKKLKPNDQKRVLAGDPLVLKTDPKTGEILSIGEVPSTETVQTYSVVTSSNCSGASGCYEGKIPYISYGFLAIGTGGTVKGSWPGRTGYRAYNRYVSACSNYTCYIKLAPGQVSIFTGTATGTSFTVY